MQKNLLLIVMLGLIGTRGMADSNQTYVPIYDVLSNEERPSFNRGVSDLELKFNDICGDTFCEGEFSNLIPVEFNCSVEKQNRTILKCHWLIAGSYSEVDPQNGDLHFRRKFFDCDLGIHGTAEDFLDYLAKSLVRTGLDSTNLPGTDNSLYDHLVQCFR